MSEKKKLTVWDYIARAMAVSAFIGVVWAGFKIPIAYGKWVQSQENYNENLEKRIFLSESDRTKHYEHVNSEYTPVKSYQKQERLDSIYNFALEQMEERKIKDSLSKVNKVKLDSSRNKRSQDIEEIKTMLYKFDSINYVRRVDSTQEN